MSFEERLERVLSLREALRQRRAAMVALAVENLRFTVRDCEREVDVTIDRLGMFTEAAPLLSERVPLRGPESRVALMLAYNGSAWLSTAITSIYLVGNRVDHLAHGVHVRQMQDTRQRHCPLARFHQAKQRGMIQFLVEPQHQRRQRLASGEF
jgi:hypothetical protein